jgi:hypothetical protein
MCQELMGQLIEQADEIKFQDERIKDLEASNAELRASNTQLSTSIKEMSTTLQRVNAQSQCCVVPAYFHSSIPLCCTLCTVVCYSMTRVCF